MFNFHTEKGMPLNGGKEALQELSKNILKLEGLFIT